MRRTLGAFLCLLLLLAPAAAEDEKKEEPKKPANEMTEGERQAALERAKALVRSSHEKHQSGHHDEAMDACLEALRIRREVLGREHLDVAKCLHDLGALHLAKGGYRDALVAFEESLGVKENLLGAEHVEVGLARSGLASTYLRLGDYGKAQVHGERALKTFETALGREHEQVGLALNSLGLIAKRQGLYEDATSLYTRALRVFRVSLGDEHLRVALVLNNLGALARALGSYVEAREHYEHALEIRVKALGDDHPRVATTLHNLGTLHSAMGSLDEAQPLLERALEIRNRRLGPRHPVTSFTLSELGLVARQQNRLTEARQYYERAISIRESALGKAHPLVAKSRNLLGATLLLMEAHEAASAEYSRALEIIKATLGSDHSLAAVTMSGLGAVLIEQKRFDEALVHARRAREVWVRILGATHPNVAHAHDNVARALWFAGRTGEAREEWRTALALDVRHLRNGITGRDRSGRNALAARMWDRLAWYVGTSESESCYESVLQLKGLVSRLIRIERRLAASGGSARADEVSAAERRLAKLANSPPSFRDKAKKAAWQKAYAEAAAEREELALALQRDFAPLREGLERLDLGLADIQARLGKDAVLLDFLRSGDEYIAWIVRHEGEPKRIDLGKAEEIEEATAAFTEAAVDSDDAEWRKAGAALRDLVFGPIAKHLGKDVKTIYVCPDAALAAVPFGALPNTDSVLSDRYLISTISMAQDLVPWPDETERGQGALLLGGVDYGEASVGEKEEKSERTLVDRAPRGRKFLYLPGTKAEAETIKSSLGKGTTVLLAKEATENRLRTQSKGKRVLHLATHGFVRDDLMRGLTRRKKGREWLGAGMERQLAAGHDPMLLAGLAMAGANPRKGGHGDDGILTALEASHLNLDGVELVVLSACQTALGKAESGEGVIGLVQGFQMAGAKRVIGSLWKVDDDATQALMVKFYELWSPKTGKGIGAALALKKAQTYVRQKKKWKHPYYWAAWVLWGPRD